MEQLITAILDCYLFVSTKRGVLYMTLFLVLVFVIIVLLAYYLRR